MSIDNIPVEQTLETVKRQIEEEKSLSPALRSSLQLLLGAVRVVAPLSLLLAVVPTPYCCWLDVPPLLL